MVSKKRFKKADAHMRKWDWEYILKDLKQKCDKHLGRLSLEDKTKLKSDPEKDLYSKKDL
jgi:hypothetical protein